jgi:hypothetical protein
MLSFLSLRTRHVILRGLCPVSTGPDECSPPRGASWTPRQRCILLTIEAGVVDGEGEEASGVVLRERQVQDRRQVAEDQLPHLHP